MIYFHEKLRELFGVRHKTYSLYQTVHLNIMSWEVFYISVNVTTFQKVEI